MRKISICIAAIFITGFFFYCFTEMGRTFIQNIYALWIMVLEFFGYGAQETKTELIIASTFLPTRG